MLVSLSQCRDRKYTMQLKNNLYKTIIARGLSSLTGDVVLCVLLYLILKQGRENVGFIPIYGVV